VQFENQNAFLSWMPRLGFFALAAFGIGSYWAVVVPVRSFVFAAITGAMLVPWLALTLWASWRSQPVGNVTFNAADSQLVVRFGSSETSIPATAISGVTSLRGLVWIQQTPAVRRSYVLALYDDELMRFVSEAARRGIRIISQDVPLPPETVS